ncbi:MAG: Xaa-Pro peptidase family protein [Candidatus Hydrogenedentes bacterium]|nr:Xaa-Pro peptidase family protein [Candidatus Hydrogenedentota bacterium]
MRIDRLRARLANADCEAFLSFAPATNQWLTGFRGSTSAVIVTQGDAIFLNDFRYTEQAATQVMGFSLQEVPGNIQMRAGEKLAELGAASVAFEPGYMTVADLDYTKSAYSGELRPAPDIVSPLRMVKDKEEIDTIRAAGALAEGVLADLIETLKPGITERELAAKFEFEFKARGATGASFDTIALFGSRGSLPHGQPGDKPLEHGDIVLLDFGCRLNGYCSDLTRTFAFGTIPGAWFEDIYHLTLTAQRRALEAVGPGKACRDVDAIARDIITEGGHGKHFGHGLGHGVGIEIHETPRLNPESSAVLSPGVVVTVEPGIYLPGQGGVRIEDLVVVTEDGCENLSKAPKELRVLGV